MTYAEDLAQARRVVAALGPRLPTDSLTHIDGFLDVGEIAMAVDLLLAVLLLHRAGVGAEERSELESLVRRIGPAADPTGDRFLRAGQPLLDVLDPPGVRRRRRGVPPLRGGHIGPARAGATRFPEHWNEKDVDRAAREVVDDAPEPHPLPNGRTWRSGTVSGIRIGVLLAADGQRRATFPLRAPGVREVEIDPVPSVPRLLAATVRHAAERSLAYLRDTLDPADHTVLDALLQGGELEEFADALAAALAQRGPGIPEDGLRHARALIGAFDLPVDGCAYLDDRDTLRTR